MQVGVKLIAIAVSLMWVAGCGKRDDVAPKPVPATATHAPAATQTMKVGFVYVSPVSDAGWSSKSRVAVWAAATCTVAVEDCVPV